MSYAFLMFGLSFAYKDCIFFTFKSFSNIFTYVFQSYFNW